MLHSYKGLKEHQLKGVPSTHYFQKLRVLTEAVVKLVREA
jgi:hypothetical protein